MKVLKKEISLVLVLAIILAVVFTPTTSHAATYCRKTVSGNMNCNINYTFTTKATVYTGSGVSYFFGKKTTLNIRNEGKNPVIYQILDKNGKVTGQGLLNPSYRTVWSISGNGAKYTVRFSMGTNTPSRISTSVLIWTDAGSVS